MKKIIYASDMDRTLIYSTKFLNEYPSDSEKEEVEYYREDFSVYMNKKALEGIRELNKEIYFVPVTSRTIEQYKNIKLGFMPEFVITSCGGKILHNGNEMESWNKYVHESLNSNVMNLLLNLLREKGFEKAKILDDCFIFFKSENPVDVSALMNQFEGFNLIRQDKKFYIVPKHISKKIALEWLKNNLKCDKLFASGDSGLDMEMLDFADKAMIPDTSYIVKDGLQKDYMIMQGGIDSPLKMIEEIRKNMK